VAGLRAVGRPRPAALRRRGPRRRRRPRAAPRRPELPPAPGDLRRPVAGPASLPAVALRRRRAARRRPRRVRRPPRRLTAALAGADRLYGYLYWDRIDATGHVFGPSSPEFDDACLRALDAVYAAFFGPQAPALADTLLILTADHGQIEVAPDTILDVDLLVEGLADRLTAAPAGSPRDLFLHVAPEDVAATVADLRRALGDRATVHHAPALFPDAGPRLLARLAPICVLPCGNHTAWLSTHHGRSQTFLGHHGGRTPEESTTSFGALALG
jgi:Type I phosphodiesterase / nucleotide pyrophosphatase